MIQVIDNICYIHIPKKNIVKEEALKYFELYPIKFLCFGKDSSKLYTKEDIIKW